MQLLLSPDLHPAGVLDLSDETPIIGLSGGINSAALLCYLAAVHPEEARPRRLLLYYAHLREHSPDTFRFVADGVRYARRQFGEGAVTFGMHRASVLDYFEAERFIPHPAVSPCTSALKVEPMNAWAAAHGATVDLIGYVREERRRIRRQRERGVEGKAYPIAHLTDAECLALVDREIGWHPAIYDLRREDGRPAFRHNNCLPCKNMHARDFALVGEHFPGYWRRATASAGRISEERGSPAYWGRAGEYAGDPCAVCAFD